MPLGHVKPRRFKPTGKGGGSKKGKPQSAWPLIIIVVADAVRVRAAGSEEAGLVDRNRSLSLEEFRRQMAIALPGLWEWVDRNRLGRVTDQAALLWNRPYKMVYSGTSDRGPHHDPKTRAAVSREHWRRRVPAGDTLETIFEEVRSGRRMVIENWQEYLSPRPLPLLQ